SDSPLRIGLGFSTAGTLPGIGPGFATVGAPPGSARGTVGRWDEAEDCAASLEVGRVGGAPLRVSARCPVAPGAVPPVTFGLRTEFCSAIVRLANMPFVERGCRGDRARPGSGVRYRPIPIKWTQQFRAGLEV